MFSEQHSCLAIYRVLPYNGNMISGLEDSGNACRERRIEGLAFPNIEGVRRFHRAVRSKHERFSISGRGQWRRDLL